MYDLLIKNGAVVDPGGGHAGRLDVAVKRGRIEAVEADIPTERAARVFDATDMLVTPGLIDLHSHVYHKGTSGGIDPDPLAAKTGVTTWLDAGSAGAFNLAGLRDLADRARARVYAFVNISSIGLVAHNYELSLLEYCSADLLKTVVDHDRDFVVGVKYRAGRAGGARDLEPLRRAKRASAAIDMPLLVHISRMPPTIEEVLDHMGPGDILSHAFTALDMKILDDEGGVLERARQARDAGILIDVGHGSGSFSWETAEALTAQGFWPDTISTDIHQKSVYGRFQRGYASANPAVAPPALRDSDAAEMMFMFEWGGVQEFDLLDCMSKFLHLGWPVENVIRSVTATPARAVGLDGQIGSFGTGMYADIALLRIEEGEFELHDSKQRPRVASRRFICERAFVGGRPLPRSDALTSVPWVVPV
jgi:dihydroorotase